MGDRAEWVDPPRQRFRLVGRSLEGARVQSVPGVSRYILRVKGIPGADSTSATEKRLRETIAAKYPGDAAYEVLGVTSFGPETGDKFEKIVKKERETTMVEYVSLGLFGVEVVASGFVIHSAYRFSHDMKNQWGL